MSGDDDMSNGEIARRLTDLSLAMREGFAHVNDRLDRYLLTDVYTSDRQHFERRLDSLERRDADRTNGTRWGVGTALSVAAIVVSLISAITGLLLK